MFVRLTYDNGDSEVKTWGPFAEETLRPERVDDVQHILQLGGIVSVPAAGDRRSLTVRLSRLGPHSRGDLPLFVDENAQLVGEEDGVFMSARGIWHNRTPESIANAHLFAAAPKLLAALRRLAHIAVFDYEGDATREEFHEVMKMAESAIATAEGEEQP